jgi:hypothetical protein
VFSLTCAQALACGWLVVTNPLPGESLPLEVYRDHEVQACQRLSKTSLW